MVRTRDPSRNHRTLSFNNVLQDVNHGIIVHRLENEETTIGGGGFESVSIMAVVSRVLEGARSRKKCGREKEWSD